MLKNYTVRNLKYLRDKSELTIREAAEAMNIKPTILTKYEKINISSLREPDCLKNLLKICTYYKVNLADLLRSDLKKMKNPRRKKAMGVAEDYETKMAKKALRQIHSFYRIEQKYNRPLLKEVKENEG